MSLLSAASDCGIPHEPGVGVTPFPDDVPIAPLLCISLKKLLQTDGAEEDRLWQACRDLGFFYIDLRTAQAVDPGSGVCQNSYKTQAVDGLALLNEAERLFEVQKHVFKLPVEEKQRYKGYGAGFIDKDGTPDRTEFYNISKDDILSQSPHLPAPAELAQHRPVLSSFIRQSHTLAILILDILTSRLGLPPNALGSIHRLSEMSGDQVRFIHAPPQPADDRRVSLGEHTDFGSVTILFNKVGGLQVKLPKELWSAETEHSDGWAYVRPLPGCAIVNLGDALVKFTAGVLRSNIHRVTCPPKQQASLTRYSLVYFVRPEDAVFLRPIKGSEMIKEALRIRKDGEEEEAVNSKDWVLRRGLGSRTVGQWEKSRGTEGSQQSYK
ncbi:Clavaminate synthase [Fusarium agapanthi]|uniref:Clavaminate synthase n=1 Tax=Fusarium agapanthi TaxID=1803897 RepID=A0A9P5E7Y1_9HYPO|nr:Clavaminate synthase [Fusarium agapanthi]